MNHNGGRSQVNFNFLQIGGDYACLNALKHGQSWSLVDNSGLPAPSTLDANGYPTSISNGGVYTVFYVPTLANRPGNYVVRADGAGGANGIYLGFTNSIVSGSLTGTNPRAVLDISGAPTDSTQQSIRCSVGLSAANMSNLIFCHVDDEDLIVTQGKVFGTKFKQRLAEGNFGVLRYMNWLSTNTSMVTTWATRKPTGYVFYQGDEFRNSIYAGTTTNSGDDYSATLGGFVLADKATVLVKFNADAAGITPTLNVSSTGAIPIKNEYGDALSVGGNTKPLNGKWAVLVYDLDLGCWLKHGGDLAAGHQLLNNGFPVELAVQLANEMGAHPWLHVSFLALDPKTDYATQLATYCKNNLDSGLVPRIEAADEVWNGSGGFYATRYGWNKANAHWGTTQDTHNWYGKVLSTMGQDVSAVYGADRSKYQVICGVQTATAASASDSDNRLNSSKYVSVDGGSAAKNWATHVAVANYWKSSRYAQAQETTDATNWAAAGTQAAKDVIISAYLAANDIATQNTYYGQWKTWANGFAVGLGMNGYEGGYTPDYTGDAALDAFRSATKHSADLSAYTTTDYNNFVAAGGLFPSCFQLGGPVNAWSVFDPDIYATPSPQWSAIVAFNAVSSVSSGLVEKAILSEPAGGGGLISPRFTSLTHTKRFPGMREVIEKDDERIYKALMEAVTSETIH